jgi:bifunctional UDP-N-acetylglucosamine pyrophosphorylase/glucosamine-1-phosphate N-acetyltransferase
MSTTVIILAAGKGTRMRSNFKSITTTCRTSFIGSCHQTAKKLNASNIITIYGHGGDRVQQHLPKNRFNGSNKLNNWVQVMLYK